MKNILKKGIVIIGILVVLFIFYNTVFYTEKENSFYEILSIKKGNITTTTLATGKVLPRDEVLIKPQISGIISEILKSAGDYVEKGDIIATVKVVPEISILSTAESRVRIAKISFKQIENDYKRQKELFSNGVITEEEMDKSEADFNKAIEEVANSEESLEIIKTGISKNTLQYSNTQIRSTIAGMILDIPIKVGNSVIQANNFNDGTTIATIANMNDMVFIGKIDETEVEELYIDMPIKLRVGAIKKQKFDAKLEYISPKSIDENGAILFEIKASTRIPNTTLVRAGYSANAEIVLAQAKDILKIPERAIKFQNDSAFVYVFLEEDSENRIVEKRLITIGISDGIEIEVKFGLSLTDKIIPKKETLEDRSLIRVRSSIVKDMTRIKQRIKSMLYFYGIEFPKEFEKGHGHWSKRFTVWLKSIKFQHSTGTDSLQLWIKEAEQQRQLLLEATKKIKELSSSERYSKNIELIRSIPGIGLITGMILLAEIEDIARFENSDKLAGFIGLIPTCHSSGERENKGGITPRKHNSMRKTLVESSWVATKRDPALSLSFSKYCKRMESNKAITRIARKLINRVFFVLTTQQKYEYKII